MSDTSVSRELYLAHKHLGFELDELVDLIIFGFKSAFLPYRTKVKLLRTVFNELNELAIKPKTQTLITPQAAEAL
jgi:adenosine deaminase